MRLRLENTAGRTIDIAAGHIAGGDVSPDLCLDVGAGELVPGLINAHDHLHRNHYARLGTPPWDDAYDWGADIHERCAAQIAAGRALDRDAALLFGALKNLLGGVTTVVHHDAWEPAFESGFPLRVARVATVHSPGFEPDLDAALATARVSGLPLCIHVAEGTNRRAAGEVAELQHRGALDARLLAVHGVGVDAPAAALLRAAGAALVWCPSSNLFLFGRTAPPELFDGAIDVLIGTDALLTGTGTLLDELRVARRLDRLADARLAAAVGTTAARRLRLGHEPSLAAGAPADIVLLRRPLLEARAAHVGLVLVGGRVVLADAAIAGAGRVIADAATLTVGGVPKLVEGRLARAAERVFALTPECARILA